MGFMTQEEINVSLFDEVKYLRQEVERLTKANEWLANERQELLEARVQLAHVRGPSLPCGHHPEHRRESGSHVFCTLCITRDESKENSKRETDLYNENQRLKVLKTKIDN